MKSKLYVTVVLISMLLVGGCIIGDQVTTLTINPDGSADLVEFRSNIRSSEAGDRGEQEVADYKTSFESRSDHEMSQITTAGGQIVSASWIRQERPYSNHVHAFFPTALTLEKYLSDGGRDDGYSLTTQFLSEGTRRRLNIRITMPIDQISSIHSSSDIKQQRQVYADGISETRIVVTRGSISSASGFDIAKDKQSALVNINEIADALRMGHGKAEFHLEWQVTQ